MGRQGALRRIPLMPLAGLVIVTIAGIAAMLLSIGVARANHWVKHSIRTQVAIVQAGERLSAFESAFRGFMVRGNRELLPDADAARRDLIRRLAALRAETIDHPGQQANLDALDRLVAARVREVAVLIRLRETEGLTAAANHSRLQHARTLMRDIRARIDAMFAEEERLRQSRQARLERLTLGLAIFLAGAVLLVVVVAYLTVTDATARYAELEEAHESARAEMAAREIAESQLRQSQKMETIGQLTGGIAHDFNNMLAVIVGSLDIARRAGTADPDRLQRSIAEALAGAERAGALVTRLLAFSRHQPLSPVPIDVNVLVNSMSELLRRTMGDRMDITIRLAPALWPCFVDASQLENAILNLAVNARDAIQGGTGRLELATANEAIADAALPDLPPGDYVAISVSDDGSGMTADVIARAFDPFFTTKEVGKGTGLGLSQVFGFAKQSGGHVTIASQVGRGTRVTLHLPRHMGAIEAAAPPAPAPVDERNRAGETVLVVEDEPHVRQFSTEALRELGYTVIAAPDGPEALRVLDDAPDIALLFTDVLMPGMTGPALARAALAKRPSLKLLYTTGYAPSGEGDELSRETANRLLKKPFTISQLASKVREAIDA